MSGENFHDIRPEALHYAWDNSFEPVAEVESDDEVVLHVRDASDGQITRSSTAEDVSRLDLSHVNPVCGPVYVKGAKPGDVIEVQIIDFDPADWGWTAIIPGFGLLADEFPDPWLRISTVDLNTERIRFSDLVTLPYNPFPGTIGLAPAAPGPHSLLPPTVNGGNLDIKHLVPGTRLFLPVAVEGGLFSVGDTHAAQGDGEVCGTAIETSMDIVIRLSIRRYMAIEAPQYFLQRGTLADRSRSAYHVCTGVGPDLMEATRSAVRAGIHYLTDQWELDREEAYALLSVAADLRLHEVVDAPNWVVGLFIPMSVFEGGEP